jgi:hypothetical protein|uniref:DUF2634 domain-containing protein n=1 Tax=Siphoviridae sp. ctVqj4 TaxID=2826359 RepID=A0A8S5NJZ2_9CAUD|nr:MAG TPA: Protein of unknown function (DUF2634) [Siphoviridae sp. ctVqj4]
MFPEIKTDIDQLNQLYNDESSNIKPIGKTFVFNYKTGQHLLIDGRMVECTLNEAISQWIEKVLRTALGKYGIYIVDEDEDFGISIYNYIGERTLHMGYVASELKREITEQLLKHRYIERIEDYTAQRNRRTLEITFNVVLITGDSLGKELQIDGL